jgi:hypothetical protein
MEPVHEVRSGDRAASGSSNGTVDKDAAITRGGHIEELEALWEMQGEVLMNRVLQGQAELLAVLVMPKWWLRPIESEHMRYVQCPQEGVVCSGICGTHEKSR